MQSPSAEMAADPDLAASYRGLVIEPTRMLWRAAVEAGIARGDLAAPGRRGATEISDMTTTP